jgi:hypothetical protein
MAVLFEKTPQTGVGLVFGAETFGIGGLVRIRGWIGEEFDGEGGVFGCVEVGVQVLVEFGAAGVAVGDLE